MLVVRRSVPFAQQLSQVVLTIQDNHPRSLERVYYRRVRRTRRNQEIPRYILDNVSFVSSMGAIGDSEFAAIILEKSFTTPED